MASLRARLTAIVSDAFEDAGYDRAYGEVRSSDRPDLGQFQCNGALAAARPHGTAPREIAGQVVERLDSDPRLRDVSVAGPGFINLTVTDRRLAGHLGDVAGDDRLGAGPHERVRKVVVDYGGPNVAKPMHVGHLRAAIIGESVKRLGRFVGHEVVGDVHLGDWGLQMGLLIAELRLRRPELPYFDPDSTGPYPEESPVSLDELERLYPAANERAETDPEFAEAARRATFELQQGRPGYRALWRHFVDTSVSELRRDYARLGVEFDLWMGESDVQDRIPALLERLETDGLAYESEGALVMDVSEPDDAKELPPLMLRKSDGAVLYGTTDLATIEQRVEELGAEVIIYVVDNRQAHHFTQVFRGARRAGIAPPEIELEHAGFGTMNGPDGKPFRTREGGVMRLKDLVALVTEKARQRMAELEMARDYPDEERESIARTVGTATLKYADLMNHRAKDYVFDLDRFSAFEGRTGPYLLYSAVRTRSILRKAAEQGLESGDPLPPVSDLERDLMLKLAEFPDRVNLAFEGRAPNHLCEYGFDLANAFNRFYHEHHILGEPDRERQASWLAVAETFVRTLELALDLLGIEVPERM